MAYIYKVIVSAEGAEDKVHFDTSTGSSDSFSDANRCFSDLCFKMLSADGSNVLRLIENDKIKKEMDHEKWMEFRVNLDHIFIIKLYILIIISNMILFFSSLHFFFVWCFYHL